MDDDGRAIDRVLRDGRNGATYNVGSGTEASITELGGAILGQLGLPGSMIEIGPDRPGHDRRYLLDSSLIRAELGWSPQMDFDRGLADTADRRAGHREWRQPLRSRTPVDERAWTPVA